MSAVGMASTGSEIEMCRVASRASCSLPEAAFTYIAAIEPKSHTITEQTHNVPESNHPPRMFFTLWVTYFTYYFVRIYAIDILHVSQATSYSILLIFNAVEIPGRIIPALLADRYFGAITVLIPITSLAGLCVYIWHSVQSLVSDIVRIVFLGFFGAGIQCLFPSTLASLTKDLSKSGTRIGMVFTIISIPCLTGPPLAGKLIQVGDGNYIWAQVWGGTCLLLGCGVLFAARLESMGWRWKPAEQ